MPTIIFFYIYGDCDIIIIIKENIHIIKRIFRFFFETKITVDLTVELVGKITGS